MNPKGDRYFEKDTKWQAEQEKLRTILLDCALNEELKWGHPCYTLNGTNVLLIHAFKNYCALLFMKGALLKDDLGILVQQTKNVQAARQIRFTGLKEVLQLERTIKAYIHEAIEVEKAGLKVALKRTTEFDMPEEFERVLKKNAALKKAFYALTPGRQRGYLLHFSSAKQAKTREARIGKCVDRIMAGKGLDDVYKASNAVRTARSASVGVKLLSSGNPQIPKGDGDAVVQAYIAAMPGWKQEVGRRLDALITRVCPGVRKAVKWNTPMYGSDGQGWFLGFHCITKNVKLAFYHGSSLRPMPPEISKLKDVRYLHIHEGDHIDEKQLMRWVKQAAKLPGYHL